MKLIHTRQFWLWKNGTYSILKLLVDIRNKSNRFDISIMYLLLLLSLFLCRQWGEWCREDREHQAAAEVSLSDESKLSRHSSVREDHQGGAGSRPEQVLFEPRPHSRTNTCFLVPFTFEKCKSDNHIFFVIICIILYYVTHESYIVGALIYILLKAHLLYLWEWTIKCLFG